MPNKERDLIPLVAIVAVLIVILPVLMWALWSVWGGGYYMHGMMGYGWWFMPLIPVMFLLLLVLGAYFLLKEFTSGERAVSSQSNRALELLKERYARGELTREEYLKMKEELES
jgi:putative membrane protein